MKTEQGGNESAKIRPSRLSHKRLLLIGAALLILIITIGYIFSQIPVTPSSTEPTATFDFDTGYPLLVEFQNAPFNQTVNEITAYFSSPSDTPVAPAFSVQSYDTTFIKLSQFSGKWLYDNKPSRDSLEIKFSQPLTMITLTFATVEYATEPSNITLTAYLDSISTSPVGSTTTRGTYQTGLYPQGTLSFNSGNQPFNLIRIEIPYQAAESATNFFVDTIMVTTVQ